MEAATSDASPLNPLGTKRATGLAVLRVYANLKASAPCPAHVTLDTTWRAGRASDLALRIRRQRRLNFEAIRSFGELVMLSQPDLVDWALPSLSAVEIVDYTVNESGTPVVVEERVGVAAPGAGASLRNLGGVGAFERREMRGHERGPRGLLSDDGIRASCRT